MRSKLSGVHVATVAAISVVLADCDTLYGVQRSALLESTPPLPCVHDVVASAPDVIVVRYERYTDTGTAITLSGLKPNGPNDVFSYEGTKESNVRGILQFFQDHRGTVSFKDGLLGLNVVPPQESIDASRPVMQQIELALSRNCGVADLPSKVSEWCHGVVCRPLP
jgi:hypothetical protein